MHKSFSFKGINRSNDILLAQDGECLDVVNLRMSNGCLCPMPQPVPTADLSGVYSAVYRHEMADCYVAITADDKQTLHFFDSEWKQMELDGIVLEFPDLRGVHRVEFVGNVVSCLTSYGIFYLLYEMRSYRMLGERPSIPEACITLTAKVENKVTENSYNAVTDTDDVESTWSYNEKGYIDECIFLLNKSGYYVDRTLFRVALRLYDGSYINCSNIIYVCDDGVDDGLGRDAYNLVSEAISADSSSRFRVSARGFKVDFSFDTAALADWRNIVVGIDLFSTASIMGKKVAIVGRTSKFERYTEKTLDELWDDVSAATLYYKVAEFDFNGKKIHSVTDLSPANLALQEGFVAAAMPVSLSSIDARTAFVYNGRLHIGALREYFYSGYDAPAFLPVGSTPSRVEEMVVHTKIRTTNGEFVVQRRYIEPNLGHDGYNNELPPLLSYPDSRAFEMTIFIRTDGVVYKKVFPLQAHNLLNLAFYLHKWYSPYTVAQRSQFANGGSAVNAPVADVLRMFGNELGEHVVTFDTSRQCWTYKGNSFPPEQYKSLRTFAVPRNVVNGDAIIFTIELQVGDLSFKDINNIPVDSTWEVVGHVPEIDESPSEMRSNVVKVSLVDNPFVFPSRCTYAPSQGSVIGISSNTSTMSQGQFGQFPLYIFCSDGIWAMQVDTSGSVAYLSCHQVSRDICVNTKSICGIAGGVVFAGRQGLMLADGNSVKKISVALEGENESLVSVPKKLFPEIASLVMLTGMTGEDSFQTYIEAATVTYLYSHNELLLCNAAYDFSYVFSFESGCWSRISSRFAGTVYGVSSALLFGHDGGTTHIFAINDSVAGDNRILLYTRPLLWGTKLPKRVMQLQLHACIVSAEKPTQSMPMLACYMLCSNDGVHFKLISGSEKMEECRDVIFPYFPTQSYKYYLFAIVGEMGKGSSIAGIEVEVNPAWNNRLR